MCSLGLTTNVLAVSFGSFLNYLSVSNFPFFSLPISLFSSSCARPIIFAFPPCLLQTRKKPDRTFHNFRASKSNNWRVLFCPETSIHGLRGSRIVGSIPSGIGERSNFQRGLIIPTRFYYFFFLTNVLILSPKYCRRHPGLQNFLTFHVSPFYQSVGNYDKKKSWKFGRGRLLSASSQQASKR